MESSQTRSSSNPTQECTSCSDYGEERRKVLKSAEDALPRIIKIMEAANTSIHGCWVIGRETNEFSELWRQGIGD